MDAAFMTHASVEVFRRALKPSARFVVWLLPRVRANPTLPPPVQPSSMPGCSDFSYAAWSAGERMVATSVRGTRCTPCAVATSTSESSDATVPETSCLSAFVTTSVSLSEENWLTSAQSMDTSPAYVVLITSFFPSMLTIAPLRWSPFFNVTCSACSDKLLQISITNTNDQTRFTTGHLFPRNEKRNLTCALKFCCWLRSLRVSRTSSYANQFGNALSGGASDAFRTTQQYFLADRIGTLGSDAAYPATTARLEPQRRTEFSNGQAAPTA